MKLWKTFIGVFFILFAVFGLLDAIGVVVPITSAVGEISLTQIAVGLLLVLLVCYCIIKSCIYPVVLLAAFIFMVFERNVATICGLVNHNIINNWLLLLFAILICIGLALILSKKQHFGKLTKHIAKGHSIGSNSIYIDSSTFSERYVENNMSSTVVKFENSDAYTGNGILSIENNMGSIVIHIPSNWKIDMDVENHMGSIQNYFGVGGDGPCLKITGENNMGSVVIQKD